MHLVLHLRSYIFLILIYASFGLLAQSEAPLKRQLKKEQGISYVEKAIELVDLYLDKEKYSEAEELAEEARKVAMAELHPEWLAICLNRQAKSIINDPSVRLFSKAKSSKILRESTQLSSDTELQIENLELLKALAVERGRDKEVEAVSEQLKTLRSGGSLNGDAVSGGILGKKKREALDRFRDIQSDQDSLTQQLAQISAQRQKLARKSLGLVTELEKREAAFDKLSQEQMRIKFRLLQQDYMLDSMAYASSLDSLQLANQKIQNAELEAQVNFQRSQRNFFLALAAVILLLAFGLYFRYQNMKQHNAVLEEKNRIIEEERIRSEELLLNILPKIVADELKVSGKAQAKRFDKATVLFADFKDFSRISSNLSPEKLVRDLDYCFQAFDEIVERHGLEKIKTIGDAYVCAGGLPRGSSSSAADVVHAALDICDFLVRLKKEGKSRNITPFEARIGIHTGPLVAGVVGKKKFAYDIWGDTVNLAARLETNSVPGKINISSSTYQLVKTQFQCEPRGKIEAKNIGEVDMYYVSNSKAAVN
ncbi:MAG TPA: adenylate/guanylate cyclase domain-containing protein [Saprospiraceae bacterium]|nr:adenylate/guanylate cyclase domain-containing protein [Saprospiraceae bacterium]